MFCGNCGKQVPDGCAFCLECGAKVGGAANGTGQETNGVQAKTTTSVSPEKAPKKKKTGLIVAVILLLIVILGVVGVVLFLNSDSQKFKKLVASAEELMDDEEYEDAAELLEEAMELKEDDEDAIEMLVEAYEAMIEAYEEDGKYDKAEKLYKKIEKLQESDEDDEEDADDNDDNRDDDDDDKAAADEGDKAAVRDDEDTDDDDDDDKATVDENIGQVLNIYCWNDEFQRRIKDHYPGYVEVDTVTGKIGNVTVKWNITPSSDNAYQNNLDYSLMKQNDAAPNDRVDIFLIESDYALKYVDSKFTLPISELGIDDSDLSNQYKYTQDVVTDSNGVLKALSWHACPGALIYNREIAKEVLGTDDPYQVQQYVSDWDSFMATADLMYWYDYNMVSTVNETYRTYANNKTSRWVINGRINIDDHLMRWAYDSKYLVDMGVAGTHDLWLDDWRKGFYPEGNVFCYFGPAWYSNFCMQAEVSGSVGHNGGWAVTEGPQGFFWGGTWICAASGTDNTDLIRDILLKITTDNEIMEGIVVKDDDYANNKVVMESFTNTTYSNKVLGGQNPMSVYANNAARIDMGHISPYDQGCNEEFQKAMKNYFEGNATFDEALDLFYQGVLRRYPELSK